MDTPPALTIGMPVYNGAAFLRPALDSLLGQSFDDFELIISDNASTDDTAQILQDYAAKDTRIRILTQAKNLGAIANFRAVYDAANAPMFMFAAADDMWDVDWIAKLLPAAQSTGGVAYGLMQTVDVTGAQEAHPSNGAYAYTGPRLLRRLKFYLAPAVLGKPNPIYGIFPTSLFSSAVWGAYSEVRNAPDVFAVYEILATAPVQTVATSKHYKRRHTMNIGLSREITPLAYRTKLVPFRRTQVPDYLRVSSWLECVLMIVLYPVARLGLTYGKVQFWRTRRSVKPT